MRTRHLRGWSATSTQGMVAAATQSMIHDLKVRVVLKNKGTMVGKLFGCDSLIGRESVYFHGRNNPVLVKDIESITIL